MNITAEQARMYADGWQQAGKIIEIIENAVEIVAKNGGKRCTVTISPATPKEALNIIKEDLKRAGFKFEIINHMITCDAHINVYWDDEPTPTVETEFTKTEKAPADDTHEMSVDAIATAFEHAMKQSIQEHTESKKTWQRGVNTKEIISDEKLHDEYFKKGKSVNTIANELGIKPWGLYKRVEEMKEQKITQETECVSKRETETPGI